MSGEDQPFNVMKSNSYMLLDDICFDLLSYVQIDFIFDLTITNY